MKELLNVLLAEDSESDALLILRQLSKDGFEPIFERVCDPVHLARALEQRSWDIVLSDYSMPQFKAPDALALVRSRDPDIPFIVISGTMGERVAVETMRAGAHDYLMKGNLHRLGEAVRREIQSARIRRERRQYNLQLTHLNQVLRAIRRVNQLIVREQDPGRLVEQVCELLVETRGYHGAWIALGDPESAPTAFAQAGCQFGISASTPFPEHRGWPSCYPTARAMPDGLMLFEPQTDCQTCALSQDHCHHLVAIGVLRHAGKDLGLIGVSFPPRVSLDEEEKAILCELSRDVAFALHDIDIERQNRHYALIVATSNESMALIDREYRYLEANPSYLRIVGWSTSTINGLKVSDVLGREVFERVVRPHLQRCLDGEESRVEGPLKSTGTPIGEAIYTPCRSTPDGEVTAVAVCIRDITERKLAEEALRKSEAQHRLAQQVAQIGHWELTSFEGTPTWSEEVFRNFGVESDGAVLAFSNDKGKVHPDDWPVLERAVRDGFELGTPFDLVFRVTRHGETAWLRAIGAAQEDTDGTVIKLFGTVQDMTELMVTQQSMRRAVEELSRRTYELESLLEGSKAVLSGTDFDTIARRVFERALNLTGAQSGYVALLNEARVENELLFLEPGGLRCDVDPTLPMPIQGLRAEAYRTGQVVCDNDFMNGQWAPLMPAGHVDLRNVLFAPLNIGGRTAGILGIANKPDDFDANDKRIAAALGQLAAMGLQRCQGEQALRREEEKYRLLADNTLDVIWTTGVDRRFTYVNPAITRLTGYEPEEWLGTTLADHWEEKELRRVTQVIAEQVARRPENQGVVFETTLRGKDGAPIAVEIHGKPSWDEDGMPLLLQATVRDITERKDLHARIAQADRLSSMGMLAAGVAHEINNPLTYILYNLESLNEDLPLILSAMAEAQVVLGRRDPLTARAMWEEALEPDFLDSLQARFRDALEGTHRIREISRGLGTFSRVEQDQLVPVNLRAVIEVAINMSYNEVKYRARLTRDYGSIPLVLASEGRLSQVFLNLIINACHAIKEGDVEQNEICVRTRVEGDHVLAEVRDTGTGIASEDLPRVFEPFFTTKPIGVGSGLGMAISKGIIEGYGGTIQVQSELGVGTCVSIRLPIRAASIKRDDSPPLTQAESTIRGRVLVIDDEEGIRAAIARMLSQHEIVQAASGAEALKILEIDWDFDVILCDMMMSNLSGIEVHQYLVNAHPEQASRLIFVTGGAFTPRVREYLRRVDNLRFEKPFDVTHFKMTVRARIEAMRASSGD